MVMMGIGDIKASTQFHGCVVVGVGGALHTQQGRVRFNLEELALRGIWDHGFDAFFCADHANTKFGLKQGIHGAVVFAQTFCGEAFEGIAGEPQIFQDGWRTRERKYTSDLQDSVACSQGQRSPNVGIGP